MYGQQNYQHALKTVNNEVQLVSVGSFENLGSAKEYYETLLQHRGAVVQAPENKTEIFYLTNSNFDRLVNAETVREYRYYFRVNFLSGRTAAMQPLENAVADEKLPDTTSLRSEEHTSELQSLMRISYAVFCLKKKKIQDNIYHIP